MSQSQASKYSANHILPYCHCAPMKALPDVVTQKEEGEHYHQLGLRGRRGKSPHPGLSSLCCLTSVLGGIFDLMPRTAGQDPSRSLGSLWYLAFLHKVDLHIHHTRCVLSGALSSFSCVVISMEKVVVSFLFNRQGTCHRRHC